jgi:hypothetical protein
MVQILPRCGKDFFIGPAGEGFVEGGAQKKHYNGLRNDFSFPAHCNASGATLETTLVAVTVALWVYLRPRRGKVANPCTFFQIFYLLLGRFRKGRFCAKATPDGRLTRHSQPFFGRNRNGAGLPFSASLAGFCPGSSWVAAGKVGEAAKKVHA